MTSAGADHVVRAVHRPDLGRRRRAVGTRQRQPLPPSTESEADERSASVIAVAFDRSIHPKSPPRPQLASLRPFSFIL